MKRLAFISAAVLLGLWQLPAWASVHVYSACSRGVYYCGEMHYISITNDNQVSHYEKEIDESNWQGPWDDQPNIRLPMPSGWKRQDPSKYGVGEGTVLYGGYMMHYAVVFDSSSTPHLICSTYDIAGGKFLPNINGLLNPTDITPLTKNASGIYGVAATVFDEKIYVFTNQLTVFTSDPKAQCYVLTNVISDGLTSYNALDAITYYPETGPPKVMVLFSYPGTGAHGAAYVIWDGPSYTPLPATSVQAFATEQAVQGGALILGTICGGYQDFFPPGQMVPCIQIFTLSTNPALNPPKSGVHRYEYAIPDGTLTSRGSTESTVAHLQFRLYPWYVSLTGPQGRPVLQQHIVINEYRCINDYCTAASWNSFALNSDFLVPQNKDTGGVYDWQGIVTQTGSGDTDDEASIRRSYWTLIGVILGPIPYVTNGMADNEIQKFSNVEYGEDQSNAIDHTNTWSNSVMVSSKTELKGGLPKKLNFTAKLDLAYGHGWEGSHSTVTTTSAGVVLACGSEDESSGSFGTDGWGIFLSPTIAEQDNAVYACDYDTQTGSGTYLHMDVSTVAQAQDPPDTFASLVVDSYQFKLQDPGGPDDDIPGLMTMQTNPATGERWKFPLSTDILSWYGMRWETADSPWEIVYGTGNNGGIMASRFKQGDGKDIPLSNVSTTKDSSGQTNSVKVRASFGVSGDLKIKGFEVGELSETLTAGYNGYWTSDTTTTTEFSKHLIMKYHFPEMPEDCSLPDCLEKLEVQPFILKATDESAPWIPADYYMNRPWCITWQVVGYLFKDGRSGGTCSPPASANATIVGEGGVGEDGREKASGSPYSDFAVHGGHLTWVDQDGTQTPIPIGADGFDPALGASVRVNRREFHADAAHGRWTRKGQVWKYKTNQSVKQDAFTLKLDFGTNTWDFAVKKVDFAANFPAGDLNCGLVLLVNGKYLLSTSFTGTGVLRFKQSNSSSAEASLIGLTEYSGAVSPSGQDDHIELAGTLPNDLLDFGDLLFAINGHETGASLLALEGFREALEQGKKLTYDRGGVHLAIDFGKKTWSATFKGEAAKAITAARWGAARIAVKVGGDSWCSERLGVKRFTAKLSYKN